MDQMGQVTKMLMNQADPATREQLMETYLQALKVYRHATELPPADLESRAIIAKAHNRMGFTNTMLGQHRGISGATLLSRAEVDYRRSIVLFEELYKEFPTDPKVRRYYAEALGLWGWGWLLASTNRQQEAKPHYQRAVQLLRDQIREAGTDTHATEGVNNVLSDLGSMAAMVQDLASLFETTGQAREADEIRRQLDDDINVLAARFSEPDHGSFWVEQFLKGGGTSLRQGNRLAAALDFRLVTILDPDNAEAHNHFAWAMTSVPLQTTAFNISRAVDSAKKAVELKPEEWMYWNTLGVAAFRTRDWKLAQTALEKSIHLNNGGGAIDFFFLAMTRWNQGKHEEAKKWYDQAATYVKHNPGDPELQQFHEEAKWLLKQPPPKCEPNPQPEKTDPEVAETAQS